MKSLILICDDDEEFVDYLKLLLESKEYRVKTANNGRKALDLLLKQNIPVDLIISDIKMPKVDGYEFFKKVSKQPQYSNVPFIFISGLSSERDVRLGKVLGVDDYITKPVKEKEVLAVIKGKLRKKKREDVLRQKIKKLSRSKIQQKVKTSPKGKTKESDIVILIVKWDDRYGPELVERYPKEEVNSFNLNELGNHLFQAMIPIYGQSKISQAQDVLFNIEYIKMNTYIYFDAYSDESTRSKQTQFMISVLAPDINYLESLQLKKVCRSISSMIKQREDLKPELEEKWMEINNILLTKG